jgi:hypothetical protein
VETVIGENSGNAKKRVANGGILNSSTEDVADDGRKYIGVAERERHFRYVKGEIWRVERVKVRIARPGRCWDTIGGRLKTL